MKFAYLKMHGTGNQIVVVDERERDRPPPNAEQLRELADARCGPGFDQLMWVGPAKDAHKRASYRVFNADGSEVEQCGNGVRCVARMLAQSGDREREFELESPAGPVTARLLANEQVSVSMGPPEFAPQLIPFIAPEPSLAYELELDNDTISVSVLSMGNPHCVLIVDAVSDANVAELGPLIEHHKRFPARTNVGFMAVQGDTEIDLRVHERGVGETLACGTGACAAVVAGQRLGLVLEEVRVNLPGGQVVVKWRRDADTVWLTGNAELISEGTIDL
jgi:diaminopimelate epimerase